MQLPNARHIKQLIGAPCLVQRDRPGRAFFISDYPRRLPMQEAGLATNRLGDAGYAVSLLPDGLFNWTEWTRIAWRLRRAAGPLLIGRQPAGDPWASAAC